MRRWFIGLCPFCGSDKLSLDSDNNVVRKNDSCNEHRVGIECRTCARAFSLGIRQKHRRLEFAWLVLKPCGPLEPVCDEDGNKAPVEFMVEEKP